MPKPARIPMPVERAYLTISTAITTAIVSWVIYASVAERIRPETVVLAAAIIASISAVVLIGQWAMRRSFIKSANTILDRIDGQEDTQTRNREWRDYADELAEQVRASDTASVTYLHPNGHRP